MTDVRLTVNPGRPEVAIQIAAALLAMALGMLSALRAMGSASLEQDSDAVEDRPERDPRDAL